MTSQLTLTDIGLEGVVRGLTGPTNQLQATAPKAQPAVLTLTNRPLSGPFFSGTQQQPFVCESPRFRTRTGVRLGPVLDDRCSIEPTTSYVYLSSRTEELPPARCVRPDGSLPSARDLASTTLPGGARRPFIVQVDTMTDQPRHRPDRHAGRDRWRDSGWNQKLIYGFGGRCGVGYRQGMRAVRHLVAEPAGPGVRRRL